MSSREQKLLSLLLLAGFIMFNFFLYSQYIQKKSLFQANLEAAKNQLQRAILIQDNSEQLSAEMQWLTDNEPEITDAETVQGKLQAFIANEASTAGLTIKGRQEFLPTDTSGAYYHRAQIKITVTGQEQDLYRWLHVMNDPAAFRSAIQIRLSPNTQDDALIDCIAVIGQWFPTQNSDS
jgi:type II secretory pathway pseudopilin PulG